MDGGFLSAMESYLSGKKSSTLSAIQTMSSDVGNTESAEDLPRLSMRVLSNRLDFSSAGKEYRNFDFRIELHTSSKSEQGTVAGAVETELRSLAEKPQTLTDLMEVGAGCSQLDIVDHRGNQETQLLWSDRIDVSCNLTIPRS